MKNHPQNRLYVIIFLGHAGQHPGAPFIAPGTYLKSHVDTPCGRGETVFTDRIHEALTFLSPMEAMQFWQQQSLAVPLRPDGKPNRPLTAFTCEIAPKEVAEELESDGRYGRGCA